MEICHHCVASPTELHLLFPKIVSGHKTGLPAIPAGTLVVMPTQHLQVEGISIFPTRNNGKMRTSVYTDICKHSDIFLTPYSYHIQLR